MRDQFTIVIDSLRDSWFQVAAFLPRAVVAVLLLIAGWLIARGIQWVTIRLFRAIRLDAAAERSGVDDFLVRGGVRFTVVTLAGQIVYWGVLLIFAVAVFNVLGLTTGPELAARLSGYVPNMVTALIVLVIGSLVARFVRGIATAYLNNIGVQATGTIGLLVEGALLSLVVILALEQLGIDIKVLTSAFELAFGGLCLAVALAFGLGGRSWAEAILARTRANQ